MNTYERLIEKYGDTNIEEVLYTSIGIIEDELGAIMKDKHYNIEKAKLHFEISDLNPKYGMNAIYDTLSKESFSDIFDDFLMVFSVFCTCKHEEKWGAIDQCKVLEFFNNLKQSMSKDALFQMSYEAFLKGMNILDKAQIDEAKIDYNIDDFKALYSHISIYKNSNKKPDRKMKLETKISNSINYINTKAIQVILPAIVFHLYNTNDDVFFLSYDKESINQDYFRLNLFRERSVFSDLANKDIIKHYKSFKSFDYIPALKRNGTDTIFDLYVGKDKRWIFLLFLLLEDKHNTKRKTPDDRIRYELFDTVSEYRAKYYHVEYVLTENGTYDKEVGYPFLEEKYGNFGGELGQLLEYAEEGGDIYIS